MIKSTNKIIKKILDSFIIEYFLLQGDYDTSKSVENLRIIVILIDLENIKVIKL